MSSIFYLFFYIYFFISGSLFSAAVCKNLRAATHGFSLRWELTQRISLVNVHTVVELAALALQSELGDYEESIQVSVTEIEIFQTYNI